MNSYNVAVTVCPVIFRPRVQHAEEIMTVSTYYDAFIRMIDNYHYLFDADDRFCNQANPVLRPGRSTLSSANNGVNVAEAAEPIGTIDT